MFSKYFTDSDVVAAGIVEVPVGKTKPGKNTRDNTYVRVMSFLRNLSVYSPERQAFYLIEGAVDFIVHKSTFTVCQGGSVLVPRGASRPSPARCAC
jgi:centromere protein C